MRIALYALGAIAMTAVLWLALSLQPALCSSTWSDNHIASRFTSSGCQINENDGRGWKSEWDYRSTDPKLPALRKHFHSDNFGGY